MKLKKKLEKNKFLRESVSAALYVFLGFALALAIKQVLVFGLSTDMPVVAVLTSSMEHDNVEYTHYKWLNEHMGYDKREIKSWPITSGFLIGDMPIIKGDGKYEVGDVIVYSIPCEKYPRQCKIPIIHRIIKVNEDGTYQTKGDNNENQLPYEYSVSEDQIHGKVVVVIPKVGYFKVMMTKVFGVV